MAFRRGWYTNETAVAIASSSTAARRVTIDDHVHCQFLSLAEIHSTIRYVCEESGDYVGIADKINADVV